MRWWQTVSLVILAGVMALLRYWRFDFDQNFGYLDFQLYYQSLHDLVGGKIIYRDFYWEYGILYLGLGLPLFLLLQKSFLSTVLIRIFLFPALGFWVSWLIGKRFLRGWGLWLFLILLTLHQTNIDFTSLRHLLPELGLVYLNPLVLGVSFLGAVEYVLPALIGILKKRSLYKALVIPFVYGVWLASQEASKNFYFYIREYAQSFYFNSPCRELFPRLDREGDGNLYLVPLASVVLLIISYRQKSLKLWPLLVYALVIYARVMVTPCTGYLNYGLTLLFLPLVVIFGQTPQWGKTKAITGMIIFWFLLSGSFFWLKEAVVLINSKPVNIGCLSQEKEAQYQRVADFVHQNTKKNEGVYVYPNGPYNQLTKRSSPISVASSWYYDLAPFLVSITAEQLQKEPPRLVILNLNNATSVKTRLNNLPYRVHEVAGQVVFEGLTTPVEDFINQNYEVTKKFELAWVLAKIPNPKPLKKLYVMQTVKWLIKQNNTLIELAAPELEQIDRVKIPLRVKIGPLKFFSKYVLTGWVVDKSQQMKPLSRQFAAGEWQDFWLELNRTENFSPVKIIITLSSNEGFLPWGQALIAEVKTPEVFRRAILF